MRKTILIAAVLAVAAGALAQETEITGFADASYFYDTAAKNGEFGLDQVEIDIIHQASAKTLVRADLEWVKNGETFDAQVEQAFMTYTCNGGWDFTFGKFNAPIGFELLDPVDMYQFSHALVFDYGLPGNLTGAAVGRAFGPGLDIVAYVSNGWDRNTMAGANVTWGGRLGYTNNGFAGGVSAISGKEEDLAEEEADPTAFTRTVFDVDLSYETGIWLFGGEYNQGKVTTPIDGEDVDQEWNGFLLMTHVNYASWTGLTVRYDTFDDKDGYAFGPVGEENQQVHSFTISPTFTLDENFGALVELRIDKSDQDAFLDSDGEATDTRTTVAFEMTYSW
jgi:hypothetical protein